MFEYAGYFIRTIMRNPTELTRNVRRQSAVRKAILTHKKSFPTCAASGTSKRVQVHHVIPVSVWAEGAADPDNLISLSKYMHYAIGHGASGWTSFNPWVREHAVLLIKSIIHTERKT